MSEYLSRFPTDLLAEFNRLQQQLDDAFRGLGSSSDIRSTGRGSFPAINIGVTEDAVDIIVLAPGIDPKEIEMTIGQGMLSISGERPAIAVEQGNVYAQERFAGPFRRVVSLPDDIDPDKVEARYSDGCLSVSIKKRESSKPRTIRIQ